ERQRLVDGRHRTSPAATATVATTTGTAGLLLRRLRGRTAALLALAATAATLALAAPAAGTGRGVVGHDVGAGDRLLRRLLDRRLQRRAAPDGLGGVAALRVLVLRRAGRRRLRHRHRRRRV